MTPKNVLYVYSGKARPSAGGLDLVVRQQLQALVQAGCHVTFVARGRFEHPLVTNVTWRATPAHVISSLPARYYYNAQNRFFSLLGARLLARGKFDLVLGWSRQSRSLFKCARRLGIPSFLNCTLSYFRNDITRDIPVYPWPYIGEDYLDEEYQLASALLLPSEFARKTFLAFGFPEQTTHYIGRGADLDRFVPKAKSDRPFRGAYFGLACDRKGFRETLDAWVEASIDNAELWVIGHVADEMKTHLKKVENRGVVLKGFSDTPEQFLVQCDVQILPTRLEGMAKSLVEGAACGLVTITTRESGFPILENETGYYVDRDNISLMAKHLRFLAAHPSDCLRMGLAASHYVAENLTWPRFRQRFLSALAILEGNDFP